MFRTKSVQEKGISVLFNTSFQQVLQFLDDETKPTLCLRFQTDDRRCKLVTVPRILQRTSVSASRSIMRM
jgi:hypothetical protein